MKEENLVERSLSNHVQPRCMSRLLQQRGRVSDFGPGTWVRFQARAMVINIFSPVTRITRHDANHTLNYEYYKIYL